MGCILEFNDPFFVRFDFVNNKYKQKIWIQALLQFTAIKIKDIADILGLPLNMLLEVHQGKSYFSGDDAERLAQLFLVAFS